MIRTLFLLLCTATLSAQTVLPLFPEGTACISNEPATFVDKDDVGRLLTAVSEPSLEHHAPVPRAANGRAIMIIPGGGYMVNAWELEGIDIARTFTQAGYHSFILRYRLPGRSTPECAHHIALDDARRGVQLIRHLADSLGYATDQVAVMGFSAGGHLAASLAVYSLPADPTANPPVARFSSRPDYSLPIYPVTIMDGSPAGHLGSMRALLGPPEQQRPELAARYNLPARVHAYVPPTFIAHAADDTVVPVANALRYYQALLDYGVPAELHVFPRGGHGFGSGVGYEGTVRKWLQLALNWLDAQQ